jgi:Flp pilus assembly protein TadG
MVKKQREVNAVRRGQTVVVVVLSLVALLAVLGLALDGSRLYRTRRILQNAADAAALAGAQELAMNPTTTSPAVIWRKVVQYLQANASNYTTARAWLVQGSTRLQEITNGTGSSIPVGANVVEVQVQRDETVLFGGVLGQRTALVSARARANAGNLRTMPARSDTIPIAVHYEIIRNANVGDLLTVWDGFQVSVQTPSGSSSNYGDSNPPYSGWLNLAWIHNADEATIGNREVDQSHSQANVNDWILNGNPYPIIAGSLMGNDGDFIMGNPGIRASGLQALENKRQQYVNQGRRPIFYFIVFDRYFDRSGMSSLFPTHGGFPNSLYFHAIGFVAVEVTEVRWQGSARGGKYVKGTFVAFVRSGDINPNSSFSGDAEMVKSVALTE